MSRLSAGDGPAKPLGKGNRNPGSKVSPKHVEVITDVQSSGGDYGTRKAQRFSDSPAARYIMRPEGGNAPPVPPRPATNLEKAKANRAYNRYLEQSGISAGAAIPTFKGQRSGESLGAFLRSVDNFQAGFTGHHVDPSNVTVGETLRGLGGGSSTGASGAEQASVLPVGHVIADAGALASQGLHSAGSFISGLIPSGQLPGQNDVAKNFVRNAFDLPANAITSAYLPLADASHGDFGKALHAVVDPYKQAFTDPVHALEQNPLNTALLFVGAKGAVGRGLGRAGRAVGADFASTERAPATLPETDLLQHRQYSRDVIDKGIQVLHENHQIHRADQLRAEARAVEQLNVHKAQQLEQKAAQLDPRIISSKEVGRRVDENQAATELIRRGHRNAVLNQVHDIIGPHVKHSGAALSLITQNITHATKDDLAAYRDHLANEYLTLGDKHSQRANLALRQQIDKVVSDPNYHAGHAEVAARQYAEAMRPLGRQLVDLGLLDHSQELRARLIPYAVRYMGARHDGDALVHGDGSQLSNQAIFNHMVDNGFSSPAFITHAPNARGARNYYVAANREPPVGTKTRTGAAVQEGRLDAHPDTLAESAARQQGLIDAAHGWRRYLSEFGVKDPVGLLRSLPKDDAHALAKELGHQHGIGYRAVPLKPWGVSHDQLASSLEEVNSLSENGPLHDLLADAAKGKGESDTWGIVPAKAGDQLHAHLTATNRGDTAKAFQAVSQAFKRTVLATSPRWLAGNFTEAGLRAAVEHAGPLSAETSVKILKRLHEVDPHAWEDLQARALGGGHFDAANRSVYRGAGVYHEGGKAQKLAAAVGAARETPGVKQLVEAWHGASNQVFEANARGEHKLQQLMLGKVLRDDLLPGHKLTHEAINHVVEQLRQVHVRSHVGRRVDDMYGRYGKMTPGERYATTAYAPFLHWTRNAYQFMGRMPVEHPVGTSLVAATNTGTLDERRQKHLVYTEKGAVPGWLMGSIPGQGDSHLRISHYTPFGAFDDPTANLVNLVLPQISDVVAAGGGKDFLGNKLKGADNPATATWDVIKAGIESTVPVVGQVDRILNGKGDLGTRARKVFDPFMFTKASSKKASKAPSSPRWGRTGAAAGPAWPGRRSTSQPAWP